uniref:SET domain-containing protein n=1 Tax=Chromera velia CCMP2878 TaxID=1169474 RepID=A0A0G4IEN2_9ALVE|eukprot:Cvel_13696.t1-p1 / transcript=Cvel_13696.t1 / gene=Cvel_13696 / organism=Chromera_velia_CCMP2878 / gene_product=Histone-lysine N-methyltransferase ATXR2, putative / transcript_product=Histone-lysine N-methyltransferase ATXR2, putative / location=Cvel_scaffold946:30391-41377(+) / protein_length=2012 / sequence_SO=supercontig / SO=protein_coding / is_pseudo=false
MLSKPTEEKERTNPAGVSPDDVVLQWQARNPHVFRNIMIRDLGQDRGRGLVAKRRIVKGEVIYRDEPIAAMQHVYSKRVTMSCSYCFRVVGSLRQQIDRVLSNSGKSLKKNFPKADEALTEEVCSRPPFEMPEAIPCPLHCGDVFCSTLCMEEAQKRGPHRILCNEMRQADKLKLFRFFQHARHNHENFILAAVVYAEVIRLVRHEGWTLERAMEEFAVFAKKHWYELVRDGDEPKVATLQAKAMMFKSLRLERCAESLGLLHEALFDLTVGADVREATEKRQREAAAAEAERREKEMGKGAETDGEKDKMIEEKEGNDASSSTAAAAAASSIANAPASSLHEEVGARWAPLFSLDYFTELLGLFDLVNMNVEFSNPLNSALGRAEKKGQEEGNEEMKSLMQHLRPALEEVRRIVNCVEEYECSIEADNGDRAEDSDDDEETKGKEKDKTLRPFPPFLGIALFRTVAMTNHSCWPNAEVDYTLDKRSIVRALRDVLPGEEIVQSYIDEALPLDKRQKALRTDYGFMCRCSKCRVEAGRELLGRAKAREREAKGAASSSSSVGQQGGEEGETPSSEITPGELSERLALSEETVVQVLRQLEKDARSREGEDDEEEEDADEDEALKKGAERDKDEDGEGVRLFASPQSAKEDEERQRGAAPLRFPPGSICETLEVQATTRALQLSMRASAQEVGRVEGDEVEGTAVPDASRRFLTDGGDGTEGGRKDGMKVSESVGGLKGGRKGDDATETEESDDADGSDASGEDDSSPHGPLISPPTLASTNPLPPRLCADSPGGSEGKKETVPPGAGGRETTTQGPGLFFPQPLPLHAQPPKVIPLPEKEHQKEMEAVKPQKSHEATMKKKGKRAEKSTSPILQQEPPPECSRHAAQSPLPPSMLPASLPLSPPMHGISMHQREDPITKEKAVKRPAAQRGLSSMSTAESETQDGTAVERRNVKSTKGQKSPQKNAAKRSPQNRKGGASPSPPRIHRPPPTAAGAYDVESRLPDGEEWGATVKERREQKVRALLMLAEEEAEIRRGAGKEIPLSLRPLHMQICVPSESLQPSLVTLLPPALRDRMMALDLPETGEEDDEGRGPGGSEGVALFDESFGREATGEEDPMATHPGLQNAVNLVEVARARQHLRLLEETQQHQQRLMKKTHQGQEKAPKVSSEACLSPPQQKQKPKTQNSRSVPMQKSKKAPSISHPGTVAVPISRKEKEKTKGPNPSSACADCHHPSRPHHTKEKDNQKAKAAPKHTDSTGHSSAPRGVTLGPPRRPKDTKEGITEGKAAKTEGKEGKAAKTEGKEGKAAKTEGKAANQGTTPEESQNPAASVPPLRLNAPPPAERERKLGARLRKIVHPSSSTPTPKGERKAVPVPNPPPPSVLERCGGEEAKQTEAALSRFQAEEKTKLHAKHPYKRNAPSLTTFSGSMRSSANSSSLHPPPSASVPSLCPEPETQQTQKRASLSLSLSASKKKNAPPPSLSSKKAITKPKNIPAAPSLSNSSSTAPVAVPAAVMAAAHEQGELRPNTVAALGRKAAPLPTEPEKPRPQSQQCFFRKKLTNATGGRYLSDILRDAEAAVSGSLGPSAHHKQGGGGRVRRAHLDPLSSPAPGGKQNIQTQKKKKKNESRRQPPGKNHETPQEKAAFPPRVPVSSASSALVPGQRKTQPSGGERGEEVNRQGGGRGPLAKKAKGKERNQMRNRLAPLQSSPVPASREVNLPSTQQENESTDRERFGGSLVGVSPEITRLPWGVSSSPQVFDELDEKEGGGNGRGSFGRRGKKNKNGEKECVRQSSSDEESSEAEGVGEGPSADAALREGFEGTGTETDGNSLSSDESSDEQSGSGSDEEEDGEESDSSDEGEEEEGEEGGRRKDEEEGEDEEDLFALYLGKEGRTDYLKALTETKEGDPSPTSLFPSTEERLLFKAKREEEKARQRNKACAERLQALMTGGLPLSVAEMKANAAAALALARSDQRREDSERMPWPGGRGEEEEPGHHDDSGGMGDTVEEDFEWIQ